MIETIVRHAPQPRNILGFLFGMASMVFVMLVIVSVALIGSDLEWLIAPLMLVAIVVAVGTMFGVFKRAKTNPAGLMLRGVSGPEYESIQRTLTLGDSQSGERTVEPIYEAQVVNERSAADSGTSLLSDDSAASGQENEES